MFDPKVLAIIRLIMETIGTSKLYLTKDLFVDSDSPSMIITYDTDTEQYVIELKEKERE